MANCDLSKDRVERARISIATCINNLETVTETLGWVFEANPEWNSDVKYQIEDAVRLLGMSLATLTNWWNDPEEGA